MPPAAPWAPPRRLPGERPAPPEGGAARLVYLSPVNWHSFAQRPHKFVQWWHNVTGGEVLWVNPYPARLPRWSDLARLRQPPQGVGEAVPPWLQVLNTPGWPIEPLPGAGPLLRMGWRPVCHRLRRFAQHPATELVIGKPSRMALRVAQTLPFAHKTYDAMDDFPAFHSGRTARVMAGVERALVPHVDTVMVSSSALALKFNAWHSQVVRVLNGFDPAVMPDACVARHPLHPAVLGYVGTIREWFDWPLVLQIARAAPALRIRLIGPLDLPCPAPLPPNVECLPACTHAQAIEHMSSFSAGLIPFQCHRLTHAVDPIKYYEYAALGLPVLTTSFGEMAHRGHQDGVFHLAQGQDPLGAVEAALAWQADERAVGVFRQRHSWAARFGSSGLFKIALAQQAAIAPEGAGRPHAQQTADMVSQKKK